MVDYEQMSVYPSILTTAISDAGAMDVSSQECRQGASEERGKMAESVDVGKKEEIDDTVLDSAGSGLLDKDTDCCYERMKECVGKGTVQIVQSRTLPETLGLDLWIPGGPAGVLAIDGDLDIVRAKHMSPAVLRWRSCLAIQSIAGRDGTSDEQESPPQGIREVEAQIPDSSGDWVGKHFPLSLVEADPAGWA